MAIARNLVVAAILWFASSCAAPFAKRFTSGAPTTLTPSQIAAITPFAEFTDAAYCPPAVVKTWTCGTSCAALPGVIVLLTGGENQETPDYYIAYYPTDEAIVVAHQGTNPLSLPSILDDAEFQLVPIDPAYFSNPTGANITVHSGFQATFEHSAATVLTTIEAGLATYNSSKVYVLGHSLGAAVALLEAIYLTEKLPTSVSLTSRVFGLPRVGNPAFADYVDATLVDHHRITNQNEFVPRIPLTSSGYQQPSGEIWITLENAAVYDDCPGQENINCADSVPLTDLSITAHGGPYAGVTIGECNAAV